ncbi:uncharacterized protein [Anabrus simplex]|uniref:uncharacterized protein n=1 Tax=Anabrus simplex TaxID=316456 RepID=UPI0035A2826E
MKTAALVALGLFICVAGETYSGDIDTRRCSGYCKDNTKFKYLPGHTYVYEYRIDTSTGISETSKEESRLHLAATAEVSVISQCDFRLQLRDVVVEDSNPSDAAQRKPIPAMAEFVEALERHPLLFSFQDGKVEELCPNADESPWVMNIKRGVLSVFQNSMSSLEIEGNIVYEKDVTGFCETKYTTTSTTIPMVVTKSKDLLTCTHRLDHYLSLQSTPYSSPVNIHSLPLVKSQHSCKQNIGASGLLERAICNEVHIFRPFSNGENGAKTKVSQYLILKEIISDVQPEDLGPAGFRTTLLYQHTEGENIQTGQEQTVMLILEEVEKKTKYGVEGEVPRLFAQLVTDLKTLSYPQLAELFTNTRQTPLRKFLMDAMSLVGTPDAITLMIELYRSKVITDTELDSWLTSLSLQKKPSLGMLAAISTLLDRSPRPKTILSASAMVHSYCQRNTACDSETVKDIIIKMERLLGEDCRPKDNNHMQLIIVALKGIGNAGVIVKSQETLKKCYEMDNPMEIRLAAIDAYRRLPCDVASRTDLLNTYINMRGDTEIRIAAYLGAMQCPSTQTFRNIKDVLYKEEVNQVASFVWTHLTNMQETSSRWKQGIKALISNNFLKNKFNTDVRKFSRNYEASTYFDSINAGAAIESNVIFTPQSYLPRSAMLNLTLDLFGESFNVFEVGGRAEGFEQSIENIFGPGGYFPDETVKKFLNNYREKNDNGLDTSIDKLSTAFDAKGKVKQEPEGSLYARIFGNELVYSRFKGLEELLGQNDNSSYKDYLIKLALGKGTEYMKSFSLLDASYVIPTAAGLPLEFAVNGTATVGLKYSGVMNVKDVVKGSISLSGELIPSAAVEITGTMSVRAFTVKTGISSVNRLNTNTYLGGTVKIVQGKIADIKIDVPREKMQILDVSTKLFMLHREVQHEMKGILEDREEHQGCSPDFISDILGLKLCGELAYPNASQALDAPYFPLTGPFSLRLTLFKTDNFSMYDFGYKFNPDPKVSSVSINFDTVGSQIDRKIQFLGVYDRKKASLNVNLRTPFLKLAANGMLTVNSNVKRIDGALSLDNVNFFEIHAGYETALKNNVGFYEPFFTLVYKDVSFLDLGGKVHYIQGVKYSADLKLKSQYNPIFIKGDLKLQNQGYIFRANLNSSFINGHLEGAVRKVSDYISSHAKLHYSIDQAKEQSIEISNKMLLSTKGDAELKSIQSSVMFSEFSDYNINIIWELRRGYRLFSHTLQWTFGDTMWKTSQIYRHQYLDQHIDFQLLGLLSCKKKGIDYKVDIKHQTTDDSIESHSIIHLGTEHKYIASFEYLHNTKHRHTLAAELSFSGFNATVSGRLEESLPNTYEFYVDGSLNMKQKLRLSGSYADQSNEMQRNHTFQIELTGALNGELSGALEVLGDSVRQSLQILAYGQKFQEDIVYTYDGHHNFDVMVHLADKTYKGTVSISDTNQEKGVSITLDFTTKLTFSGKITSHNGEDFDTIKLELTWNRIKYPNNRIYLIAESLEKKSRFSLEFPGQHVTGELISHPGSVESTLQWHPNKIITAVLHWNLALEETHLFAKLETPWRGLEKQFLSAQHKLDKQKALCQMELAWQKGNLAFLATGEKTTTQSGAWSAAAELKLTSSLNHLTNMTLNLEHTHDKNIESNVEIIYGSQRTSMMFNYYQDIFSDTIANLSLSLPWLEHSLKSKLTYRIDDDAYRGSIEFVWASDKEISGNFAWLRGTHFSTILQLKTPFEGYEAFVTELLFKRQHSNIKTLAKVGFKDNLYLLSLESSVSNGHKTYGKFVTPFTHPIEVSIHHEVKGNLEKDILIVKFNDKEIIKFDKNSDYLPLSGERVIQLSTALNLPSHLLSLHFSNIIGDKNSLLKIDGNWNDKTLYLLLQGNSTKHPQNYVLYYHGKIFGSVVQTPIEMDLHHVQSMHIFNTTIQIPGGISIKHILTYGHLFSWKNILNIQTPWKSGTITNMLSFQEQDFKFQHYMSAEVDGKQVDAQVTVIMKSRFGGVKKVDGVLNTPWSHPITVHFSSVDDSETQRVQFMINFKQKKIILRNTRRIQLLEKFFSLELESPYHEPLSLTVGYNIASLTKNFLMKMEWANSTLEMNSEFKFDIKDGFVKLAVTGFSTDQEMLNIAVNYNFKDKNKFIDIQGMLGENEIKGTLNLLRSGSHVLKLTVRTVLTGWENIHIDVLSTDTLATLQVNKNGNIFNISRSITWSENSYMVNITTEDTLFNTPNITLFGIYDWRSINNRKLNIVCNYNGTITELSLKFDEDIQNFVDAASLEVLLNTPLKGLEFLSAHIGYYNKNKNNQKIKLLLVRNDWKLQVEGDSTFDSLDSNANLKLILPFQEIERISASLAHRYLSNSEQTVQIVISCNDQKVEIDGSVVSNGNELLANMEVKTPITGYENIKGNFNLIGMVRQQKSVSLNLITKKHSLKLFGTLNITSLLHVNGNMRAEFPHIQQAAAAGLGYDLSGVKSDRRYVEGYLVFPTGKYQVNAFIDKPQNEKLTFELSIDTPGLVSEVTGYYELHPTALTANINVVTDKKNKVLAADLLIQQTLFNFHFTCPLIGYQKLSLIGQLDWERQQKSIQLNFVKNSQEYKVLLVAGLDSRTIETKLDVYTPIENWNEVNVHGKYGFISDTVEEFKLVAVKGDHSVNIDGRWYSDGEDIHASLNILQTLLGTVRITANITAEKYIARMKVENDVGRKVLESYTIISDTDMQLTLESIFTQLQNINITTTYGTTEFIKLEMKYRGIGSENFTSTFKLQFSNDKILIKMNPLLFNPNLRNFNSTLLYRNIFNNSVNPFVSFYVSLDGAKVLETSLDLCLDWENKLSLDYKLVADTLFKSYFTISAWITPQYPPTDLSFTVKDQHKTWLDISSVIKNVMNNGFTYEGHITTATRKKSLILEYYPEVTSMRGLVNFTDHYGKQNSASATFSQGKELTTNISLPTVGFDKFSLNCKYGSDFIDATLKMPFSGYEQISVSGKLKIKEHNKKSITFFINKNNVVSGTDIMFQYGPKYMEITFELVTPFENLEKFRYASQYDMRGSKKIGLLRLEVNEDVYKLAGEATFEFLSANGLLQIFTPIPEFKNTKFQISYDFVQSSSKIFIAQGEINDIKHLDLNLELLCCSSEGKFHLNSQLPLKDISFSFTGNYDFSDITKGHAIDGRIELQGMKTNMALYLTGEKSQYNQGKFEMSVLRNNVPFSVDMRFLLLTGKQEKKAEFISNIQGKRLELNASSVIDFNNIELTLSSLLPSYGLNSITIQWDKNIKNQMNGKIEVNWKSMKIMNILTSLDLSSAGLPEKFSLAWRSIFKNFEEFTFTSALEHSNGLISESTLRWNKDKSIILIGSFSFKPHKANNKISLVTTFTEPLLLSIDYNFISSEQSLDAKLGYGSKKFQMQIKYIPAVSEITLTTTTPFQGFTYLQLDGKFSFGYLYKFLQMTYQQEDYKTHLTAQMIKEDTKAEAMLSLITPVNMLKKFVFNGTLTELSELSSSLEINWGDGKFMTGSGAFSPQSASLQINSTIANWEYINVKSGFINNSDINRAHFSLRYGNEVVDATANITPHYHGNANINISVRTPWTENITVQGIHKLSDGHLIHLDVQYGASNSQMDGKFKYEIKDNLCEYRFEAVLSNLGKLTIHTGYNKTPSLTKLFFKQEIGTLQILALLENSKSKQDMVTKFHLETPFKNLRKIDAVVELNFDQRYGLIMLDKNREIYRIHTALNLSNNYLAAQVNMQSPYFNMDNASLDISFTSRSVNVSIEAFGKRINARSIFAFQEDIIAFYSLIEIPFIKSLEQSSFSFNVDVKNLSGSLHGHWNGNDISAIVNLNPTTLHLIAQTPFTMFKIIQLSGKLMSNARSHHNFTGFLEWEQFRLDMTIAMKTDANNPSIYSTFKWNDEENITLEGNLQIPSSRDSRKQFNVHLQTPFKGLSNLSIVSGYEIGVNTTNMIDFILSAPNSVLPSLEYSLKFYHNENDSFNLEFNSQWMAKEITLTVAMNNDDPEYLYGNLVISIPYQVIPPVKLHGKLNRLKSNASVQLQIADKLYDLSGSFALLVNNLTVTAEFQMPSLNCQLSFKNIFSDSVYKGEAIINVNNNKMSSAYESHQHSMNARLSLNMPMLKLPYVNTNIVADYSEYGVTGNLICKYLKYESKITFNSKREPYYSQRNQQNKVMEYYLSHFSFKAEHSNGKFSRSCSLTFENNNEELSLVGHIITPDTPKKEASFIIKKNDKQVEINLADRLNGELSLTSDSGFIFLSYGKQIHKLQYSMKMYNGLEGTFLFESPLVSNGRRNMLVIYKNTYSGIQAKFSTDSGLQHNSALLEMETRDNVKLVRMEIISQNTRLLGFESELYVERERFIAKTELDVSGVKHSIQITYKPTLPLHSQLIIDIPSLLNRPVTIMFSTEGQLKAYAGYGNISDQKYIMLEAKFSQEDGKVNVTLHTPFLSFLKVLNINGECVTKTDLQKFSASLSYLYHFDRHPIEASLKFFRSYSALDSHFRFRTPLQHHDHYEGYVHIPFILDENPHFNISLKLPHVKYLYAAALRQEGEAVQFTILLQHRDKFANATFALEYSPKFSIFMEINTPFSDFRHYCLDLNGQRHLKNGNNVMNYVEWNNKRIELIYSFVIERKEFVVQVDLNTPFHNFEHYAMRLQYDNQERKVVVATLTYPGLDKAIGIEFDYLYKGIFDINLITQFSFPFLPWFQAASFLLANKLDIAEGCYQAMVAGHINERKFSLAVEGLLKRNEGTLEIQAQQNDKEIYLKAVSALDNSHRMYLWEMRTPIPIVKNIKLVIQGGTNRTQIGGFYNSREIVGLDVTHSKSHINFELRNPIRPVSLSYTNQLYQNGLFSANICWDLNNKLESQFGVDYSSKISPRQRWEFQSKLKLPTRILSYDLISEYSMSDLEYAMHFSWEEGKKIGYHILRHEDWANTTVFGQIDLPSRSFEGILQSTADTVSYGALITKMELLWDAAGDKNKKLGLNIILYQNDTLELTAKYAFLSHDIIVQLEKQFRKESSVILDQRRIKVIYSPNPEDTFTMGSMYEYQESDKLLARISMYHKPSKLHLDSKLELSNHAEGMVGKLNITYFNFDSKEIVSLISFGKIVFSQPEIEIQFRTDENNLGIRGVMWSQKDGYDGISVHCQIDQKEPLIISTAINTLKTAFHLALSYGNKRHYRLQGQFPDWREISAEASRSLNDVTSLDGYVALRLNTSQLLWTRIEWSPRITENLNPAILQEYADIIYVINAIGQRYLQMLSRDIQINLPVVTFKDITDYTRLELNDILEDFQAFGYDLSRIYEANDFFIRDITNILKSSCSHLYSLLQAIGNSMAEMVKTLYFLTKELFSFVWNTLSIDYFMECMATLIDEIQGIITIAANNFKILVKYISRLEELLREFGKQILSRMRWELLVLKQNVIQIIQDLESVMIKCIHLLGKRMERFIENLERQVSYIQVEAMVIVLEVADVIENITATLVEIPEVQYLLDTYTVYASWLEEFHLQEYLDSTVTAIAETVDSLINDVISSLNKIKMELIGSTQPYFDDMDQIPALLSIKSTMNEVYQKIVWIWKYYQITNQVLSGLSDVLEQSDTYLVAALVGVDSDYERDSKTDLVFRPDLGLIEYAQELPVEWNGFNELPKFEQFSWYPVEKSSEEEMARLNRYSYYFLDPLNTAINKSINTLLPPLSKQAVIAGRKHFITFDNKFYDFEGECSYLLASDFLDNKFSAVINYEIQNRKVVEKSLTIVSEGHHIAIGSNNRVSIDGKKTELPVKIGQSAWIIRTGEKIVVHTNFGMALECNLYHDICTMELTGWYFGKTGGLLGTFDNEPSNDISLPDGTVTSDIQYFAKNWQVGKSSHCRSRGQVNEEEEHVELTRQESKICSSYFQHSSSPLSGCFSHIEPQSYYEMCLQDMTNDRSSGCLSAATYASQCKKIGVDVWIPPECANCPLMDGTVLKAGEGKLFTKDSPQSTDIVMVVEQANCLKSVRVMDAVIKLDSALKMKGITDAHYSVVGFGGSNFNQPHTRTADGEVWVTRKSIEKALNGLEFDAESTTVGTDVYNALWYAARLSFRAGVSKTIVLIQCNACDNQVKTDDYNDMLRLLQEYDITLHILHPDAISLEGSPEKTAKIYGMDIGGTYSGRNLANLTPRKNLLRQVQMPKDLCVPLALETNGTIFNLNHMVGGRSQSTSKKFLDVWSRRIAQDIHPPTCQKCQCVVNQDFIGQIICSKCQYPNTEIFLQDLATAWSDEDVEPEIYY